MGLLDDVMGMAGMSGSNTQPQQHAGVLALLLEYLNSPQVGGIAGLHEMFEEKRARRRGGLMDRHGPELADIA